MTERLVKICRPSGTSAAPSLTISLRGTPSIERPQISMRPRVLGANGGDRRQERAFAGAVRADNRDDLARADFERYARLTARHGIISDP